MRDYKFRVWNKKNKEMWYQGINSTEPNSIMEMEISFTPLSFVVFARNYGEDDFEFIDGEFELMQSTGSDDITHRDIFENDIVEGDFPYATRGIVTWDIKRCGFYIKPIDGIKKAAYDKGYKMNAVKLKVIGNVYENPELIGE